LDVRLAVKGEARVAGDHAVATATLTNNGARPVRDVVLMLSLADVTGSPAVPLGVEDWTPTPEGVHAAELAPGARLVGTWPLRMIQAGRLAVFATAVAGSSRSVTNGPPVVLSIAPTHNLTQATVLPVAIGVPLVLLGGLSALFWRRRREVSA
jgi:LPXTG-motif cell wall-anchored protein